MDRFWRDVVTAKGPFMGRGSLLQAGKGGTARRTRKWTLALSCGHSVTRMVKYRPIPGFHPSRGGTQFRSGADVLPAPRRVDCEDCRSAWVELPR